MPAWAWYIAGVITPAIITGIWLIIVIAHDKKKYPDFDTEWANYDWRDGDE